MLIYFMHTHIHHSHSNRMICMKQLVVITRIVEGTKNDSIYWMGHGQCECMLRDDKKKIMQNY